MKTILRAMTLTAICACKAYGTTNYMTYVVAPSQIGSYGYDLLRVSDQGAKNISWLGANVVYGRLQNTLVTIGEKQAGQDASTFEIRLWNLGEDKEIATRRISGIRPMTYIQGPIQGVLLERQDERIYFIASNGSKISDKYSLASLEIPTSKITFISETDEYQPTYIVPLPDGFGVSGVNGDFCSFSHKLKAFTKTFMKERDFSRYLYSSGSGLYRWNADGRMRRLTDSTTTRILTCGQVVSTQNRINGEPQSASSSESSLVAYGEDPDATDVISEIVIFDLESGKEVWRKRLPFRAALKFTVSTDMRFFRLVDLAEKELVVYDRMSDRFVQKCKIPFKNQFAFSIVAGD